MGIEPRPLSQQLSQPNFGLLIIFLCFGFGLFCLVLGKEESNADVVTLGDYWRREQAVCLYAQYTTISIFKVKGQPVLTLRLLCQLSSVFRESVGMRDLVEIRALAASSAASSRRGQ